MLVIFDQVVVNFIVNIVLAISGVIFHERDVHIQPQVFGDLDTMRKVEV